MNLNNNAKTLIDCTSVKDLADLLKIDIKRLFYYAYRNDHLYSYYEIQKKNKGVRKISAPSEGLKSILKELNFYLNEAYNDYVPYSATGFVQKRSILTNAERHLQKRYVLNFDLADFFGSINSGRVYGLFKRHPFIFNSRVASVITALTTHQNSLPQGSPCSPVICNLICYRMDRAFIQLAKKNGWTYSRYADDISISSNYLHNGLAEISGKDVLIGDSIARIVEQNGFQINHQKTRIAGPHQAKWVTGIKVNKKLNISRNYIKSVRGMMNALEVHGIAKAQDFFDAQFNGNKKSFIEVLRGRIAYIGHVRGKKDLIYKKLYNRLARKENKLHKLLPETLKEEIYEKVLMIKTSKYHFGSGFYISNNFIVTCAHVVAGERTVQFTTVKSPLPNDYKWAMVAIVNEDYDFALLHTFSTKPELVFEINLKKKLSSFDYDSTFIAAGFGGLIEVGSAFRKPSLVDQNIVHKLDHKESHIFQVPRPMWSGMSGGPMINSKSGLVEGYIVNGARSLKESASTISYEFMPLLNLVSALEGLDPSSKN